MVNRIYSIFRQWLSDEQGVAATEAAVVFPVMTFMLFGIWDLGNGILANQKAIAASQVVVDLIGRQEVVEDEELAQVFQAGTLALMPFPTENLVIEVISVEYDSDDAPVICWAEASTGGAVDPTLAARTAGLGTAGNGAIVVQVTYQYDPLFTGMVTGPIPMRERMFTRGRQAPVVERDGDTEGC